MPLEPSQWEQTLTFFPQYFNAVKEHIAPGATIAVVGASDGKFVLPLAAAGYWVLAIEPDPVAVHGGIVEVPGVGSVQTPGLLNRIAQARLGDRVQIIEADLLATPNGGLQQSCHAVWTSCSWHYSCNHQQPLGTYITAMKRLLRRGGLFGAEYMMPIEPAHQLIEHYTTPQRLADYFAGGWDTLLSLETSPFIEQPHVGQPAVHSHQMGLLIAAHRTDRTYP